MRLTGVGIGWRPELAGFAERRHGLGFAEVVAEGIHDDQPLPGGLAALLARVPRTREALDVLTATSAWPRPSWACPWPWSTWPPCWSGRHPSWTRPPS